MTPLVRFETVSKTYDGQTFAVRSLDLELAEGEFLTLLGPSGSGKTTTLMMLAGFEAPTAGRILLEGRSIEAVPPYRRGIGVVFQSFALFPHLTVAENLAFPLQMRRVPRAEIAAKIADALAMVRLPGVGDRRPSQLSGGQQQRVALARALIFRPKLVLMDEPLGALDKQLREHLQMEIRDIHRRLGVSIVYVTHDQSEALTMSDRIAVFRNGAVEQTGSPAEIYQRPATAFVAGFIGENNRLEGVVTANQGLTCRIRLPDGTEVSATPQGPLRPGDPAALCVRPEHTRLQAGALEATVLEVVYHGDHTMIRMRRPGGEEIRAKGQNEPLQPGDAVRLGWDAPSCLAFPEPAV